MGPQPMGKVGDLSRLARRVAARSTVRWSSPWKFLGICLLAAVVGGPNLGVWFRSESPMVCTVTGSTLTSAKAGTCTVVASQAGDAERPVAEPRYR